MTAIITTLGIKPKTVTGKVIQNGIGKIQVVVIDKKGSSSIKRFDKSKVIVKLVD